MYTVKTFNDPLTLQDYLNGVVLGVTLQPKTFGLNGLTFVIHLDGGADVTTTFSDTDNVGLSPKEILSAILASASLEGYVSLKNYGYNNPKNPQLAVSGSANYVKSTGTANSKLGFSTTSNTTVTEIVSTKIVAITVNGPLYTAVVSA
jgi:hypothetical protein